MPFDTQTELSLIYSISTLKHENFGMFGESQRHVYAYLLAINSYAHKITFSFDSVFNRNQIPQKQDNDSIRRNQTKRVRDNKLAILINETTITFTIQIFQIHLNGKVALYGFCLAVVVTINWKCRLCHCHNSLSSLFTLVINSLTTIHCDSITVSNQRNNSIELTFVSLNRCCPLILPSSAMHLTIREYRIVLNSFAIIIGFSSWLTLAKWYIAHGNATITIFLSLSFSFNFGIAISVCVCVCLCVHCIASVWEINEVNIVNNS